MTGDQRRQADDPDRKALQHPRHQEDAIPLAHIAGLQVGFAAVDPVEIRRGVREPAIALEAQLPSA